MNRRWPDWCGSATMPAPSAGFRAAGSRTLRLVSSRIGGPTARSTAAAACASQLQVKLVAVDRRVPGMCVCRISLNTASANAPGRSARYAVRGVGLLIAYNHGGIGGVVTLW